MSSCDRCRAVIGNSATYVQNYSNKLVIPAGLKRRQDHETLREGTQTILIGFRHPRRRRRQRGYTSGAHTAVARQRRDSSPTVYRILVGGDRSERNRRLQLAD